MSQSKFKKINELIDGEVVCLKLIPISNVTESRIRRGLSIFKLMVKDDTGTIMCTWFNNKYVKGYFNKGEEYIFFGKVLLYNRR